MGKGRLEAFSDGVLAIIITIMVLELKTPTEPDPARRTHMEPAQPTNRPVFDDELRRALTSLWRHLTVVGAALCLVGLAATALGWVAILSPHQFEDGSTDNAVLKDGGRFSTCGPVAAMLGMGTLWAAVRVRRSAHAGADGEAGALAAVQIVVQLLVSLGIVFLLAVLLVLEFAAVLTGLTGYL